MFSVPFTLFLVMSTVHYASPWCPLLISPLLYSVHIKKRHSALYTDVRDVPYFYRLIYVGTYGAKPYTPDKSTGS